ncbi:MAG TPA: hypothetical protein DDX92_00505 [Flavobacteriales bacterium]|nr:hypothetical protein [Flavobacteriales bacterium]
MKKAKSFFSKDFQQRKNVIHHHLTFRLNHASGFVGFYYRNFGSKNERNTSPEPFQEFDELKANLLRIKRDSSRPL